ncbi:MAG: hypothetical protein ABW096_08970 [Candidatus Thiodiazotropha sp.]
MNYPERLSSILLAAYFTVSVVGCSSDESAGEKKMDGDAGVFQGYRDSMDKAEDVERIIMQADRNRKKEMDKNY